MRRRPQRLPASTTCGGILRPVPPGRPLAERLVECLAAGRGISLPSLATGMSKMIVRATGGYARVRSQFKTPIGKFEGVEEALARMAAERILGRAV